MEGREMVGQGGDADGVADSLDTRKCEQDFGKTGEFKRECSPKEELALMDEIEEARSEARAVFERERRGDDRSGFRQKVLWRNNELSCQFVSDLETARRYRMRMKFLDVNRRTAAAKKGVGKTLSDETQGGITANEKDQALDHILYDIDSVSSSGHSSFASGSSWASSSSSSSSFSRGLSGNPASFSFFLSSGGSGSSQTNASSSSGDSLSELAQRGLLGTIREKAGTRDHNRNRINDEVRKVVSDMSESENEERMKDSESLLPTGDGSGSGTDTGLSGNTEEGSYVDRESALWQRMLRQIRRGRDANAELSLYVQDRLHAFSVLANCLAKWRRPTISQDVSRTRKHANGHASKSLASPEGKQKFYRKRSSSFTSSAPAGGRAGERATRKELEKPLLTASASDTPSRPTGSLSVNASSTSGARASSSRSSVASSPVIASSRRLMSSAASVTSASSSSHCNRVEGERPEGRARDRDAERGVGVSCVPQLDEHGMGTEGPQVMRTSLSSTAGSIVAHRENISTKDGGGRGPKERLNEGENNPDNNNTTTTNNNNNSNGASSSRHRSSSSSPTSHETAASGASSPSSSSLGIAAVSSQSPSSLSDSSDVSGDSVHSLSDLLRAATRVDMIISQTISSWLRMAHQEVLAQLLLPVIDKYKERTKKILLEGERLSEILRREKGKVLNCFYIYKNHFHKLQSLRACEVQRLQRVREEETIEEWRGGESGSDVVETSTTGMGPRSTAWGTQSQRDEDQELKVERIDENDPFFDDRGGQPTGKLGEGQSGRLMQAEPKSNLAERTQGRVRTTSHGVGRQQQQQMQKQLLEGQVEQEEKEQALLASLGKEGARGVGHAPADTTSSSAAPRRSLLRGASALGGSSSAARTATTRTRRESNSAMRRGDAGSRVTASLPSARDDPRSSSGRAGARIGAGTALRDGSRSGGGGETRPSDLWLEELRYCSSVLRLERARKEFARGMLELLEKFEELEIMRIRVCTEVLRMMTLKQQQLWQSLSGIGVDDLQNISECVDPAHEAESIIQVLIQETFVYTLDGVRRAENPQEQAALLHQLDYPFYSPLIAHAGVCFQQKSLDSTEKKRQCLLVATQDRWLHVFHCDENGELMKGSTADESTGDLSAGRSKGSSMTNREQQAMDHAEGLMKDKSETNPSLLRLWSKENGNVESSLSFDVLKATIKPPDGDHPSIFGIENSLVRSSIFKQLGMYEFRTTLYFDCGSPHKANEWQLILQGLVEEN